MLNDTLFMDAAKRVPFLGPWHVPFTRLRHGSKPSPTAKKNPWSTVRGTCAGYRALARLQELATAPVSLYARRGGNERLPRRAVARWGEYSRTAAAVVLSNVLTVLVQGATAMANAGGARLAAAVRSTSMVCPGEMTTVVAVNGFT
jgi:hypothetical protein